MMLTLLYSCTIQKLQGVPEAARGMYNLEGSDQETFLSPEASRSLCATDQESWLWGKYGVSRSQPNFSSGNAHLQSKYLQSPHAIIIEGPGGCRNIWGKKLNCFPLGEHLHSGWGWGQQPREGTWKIILLWLFADSSGTLHHLQLHHQTWILLLGNTGGKRLQLNVFRRQPRRIWWGCSKMLLYAQFMLNVSLYIPKIFNWRVESGENEADS